MFTVEPGKFDVPDQAQVPVVPARADQAKLPHVPKHAGLAVRVELGNRDLRDGSGVEPGWRGSEFKVVDHTFLHRDFAQRVTRHAPAHSAGHPGDTAIDTYGISGFKGSDATKLPSPQSATDEMIAGMGKERYLVDKVDRQYLRLVVGGISIPATQVIIIYGVAPIFAAARAEEVV